MTSALRSNDLLNSPSMALTEGLANSTLLSVFQHAREATSNSATGQLMGMEAEGRIEVTDFFPFALSGDDVEQEEYQFDMIKSFRDVNLDHSTVGWFITASFESFITQSLIETQMSYQGTIPNSILVVIDLISSSYLAPKLRALRVRPEFIALYKDRKASASSALLDIFEELPVQLALSSLDRIFLLQLLHNKELPPVGSALIPVVNQLVDAVIVDNALASMDDVLGESGRIQHYLRSSTKQQQALAGQLQRLKNDVIQRPGAIDEREAVNTILGNFRSHSEPSRVPLALATAGLQEIIHDQLQWHA